MSLSQGVCKFADMRSAPTLIEPEATDAGFGSCNNAVCVGRVDVAALSEQSLRERLKLVGRSESRLAAMKSQILAELGRRTTPADARLIAGSDLLASKRQAKRDVQTAVQLEQLPDTAGALASGEIPPGHARLIARASSEGPVDEAELVEAARSQDFDRFAKTVRRHQQSQSRDDGQALLDRQRKRRCVRIFESPDNAMFVLHAEFDQITGARIATALTAKERELWHHEDPKSPRSPRQRLADAVAELLCDQSDTTSGDDPKKPKKRRKQGTNLLVLADFDVIRQQLVNARLADGSPIPVSTLKDLALEAEILPCIFDAKTQDLWLGRTRRVASEAQRMALVARDQHCVGCEANPLWCRAHHIVWWSKNGSTDLDNLLLVCDSCHRKIHQHGCAVHRHATTKKFYLKPPPEPD